MHVQSHIFQGQLIDYTSIKYSNNPNLMFCIYKPMIINLT